jgi:autotransporter-associated beta strand protein
MALNGTDTVDTQSNALTLSGTLSGTGSLSKIGAGTLTLTDNNTYTGGTALEPAQDEYHLVVCDLDVANRVQAWASMKSFVAKDGSGEPPSPGRNGERHFHGEQRSNETHSSTTDPEAKLAKKGKGKEAKLAYTGHVMTENRNGFVVEAELRQVSGTVERETAKDMTCAIRHAGLQRYTARGAKHDQSTLRHRRSHYPPLRIRAQPKPFGWGKTIGGLARPMLRGVKKLDFKFTLTIAAYDLIKLPRLIGVTA